jgi:hypothetical protein
VSAYAVNFKQKSLIRQTVRRLLNKETRALNQNTGGDTGSDVHSFLAYFPFLWKETRLSRSRVSLSFEPVVVLHKMW